MVTLGGHRRFAVDDIQTLRQQHRQGLLPAAAGPAWLEAALAHTRREIAAHHDASWLAPLDDGTRAAERGLGRQLMGVLMQFVALPEENEALLAEARAIGVAYVAHARSARMSLTTILSAVLFFREAVLTAALAQPDGANRHPQEQRRLLGRITHLLNEVELSVVAAYESAPV
jgi:hypothetical protein